MAAPDPVALAQTLIRCPSVTPRDAGALGVLEETLTSLGFSCTRLRFGAASSAPVENLFARIGNEAPFFCFAGHTDVVPPGPREFWRHDPYAAEITNGMLFGRGAADMKSAIAAFIVAAANFLETHKEGKGSIGLLITSDEEGDAVNGTVKVLEWMEHNGQKMDHCLVGEPSATAKPGDTVKIGRRGSMNVQARIRGIQGHAAYPQRALNPIPIAAELVRRLSQDVLDSGSEHFEPSTLAFTSFDTGTAATNVIPGEAVLAFNIRFNDRHTPQSLKDWIAKAAHEMRDMGGEICFSYRVSGEAFVTQPGPFTQMLHDAVQSVNGEAPVFSTGGGTSDARFITHVCPVAELGLPGATMHQVDECVAVEDISRLASIYGRILERYFESPPI